MRFVRKFQQVEVRVGDHDILRLPAHPAAHVYVTVSCAWPCGIHVQANARGAFLAVPASTAGDVKGHRNQVPNLDELYVPTGLDHFAGDLMPEDESFWCRGTAPNHVLVAAANVGGNNLQNDAVFAFAIPER